MKLYKEIFFIQIPEYNIGLPRQNEIYQGTHNHASNIILGANKNL